MTTDHGAGASDESGSTPHVESHEVLLAAVMAGELSRSDPAARELLACAVCRDELQRLERIAAQLDAAGRERRSIMETALDPRDAEPSRPTTRMRHWPLLLAAAAALLIATMLCGPMRGCGNETGSSGPDPNMLLGDGPEAPGYSPRGDVATFGTFHWPAQALAPGQAYLVEVYEESDEDGSRSAQPVAQGRVGVEPPWLPDDAELARVNACERIQWRIAVVDRATSETVASRTLSARRR